MVVTGDQVVVLVGFRGRRILIGRPARSRSGTLTSMREEYSLTIALNARCHTTRRRGNLIPHDVWVRVHPSIGGPDGVVEAHPNELISWQCVAGTWQRQVHRVKAAAHENGLLSAFAEKSR